MKNRKNEFKNVVGYASIKNTLSMVINVIKNQEKYKKLGVNIPKGIILYGEPGIGKTTLANAFIKSTGFKSYVIRKNKSDGQFLESMHTVFEEAKNNVPAIILLDDIDKYSDTDTVDSNSEEYVAIQALIDEYKNENVFVIATANYKYRLPTSLLRAGRFDYVIKMENPKKEDAEKIIEYYLKQKKVNKDIDAKKVVKMLNGKSCAELEKVINEAGIYAGMNNKDAIEMDDIIKAALTVLYEGILSTDVFKSKYLYDVALHECGHALIGELLEPDSISFVSISNYNTDIRGVTIYNTDEDYFNNFLNMENRVKCLLAGKAALEVVLGKVDVGCNSDLNRAYSIIKRFVDDYAIIGFDTHEYCRDDKSERLKSETERKINMLVTKYYNEVKEILIKNRFTLEKMAEELTTKGVLFSDDILKIKQEV